MRYAIDETKARAPIWNAERFADGQVRIGHPRDIHVNATPILTSAANLSGRAG